MPLRPAFPHTIYLPDGTSVLIVDRAVQPLAATAFALTRRNASITFSFHPANGGCGDFCPSVTVESRTTMAADARSMTFS
jgi:hypothetical protein